jgi:hypothetical protein
MATMDICSAILAINPEARASCIEEDYDRITWLYGTTPISKSDIQAKQAELKAIHDSTQYQRDRQSEYPSIEELVVALYDSEDKAEIDRRRAEIKNKYPKP